MVANAVMSGSIIELRPRQSIERESLHVRHMFEDLVLAVNLAIESKNTLTVVPYVGPARVIDPDHYLAITVLHARSAGAK